MPEIKTNLKFVLVEVRFDLLFLGSHQVRTRISLPVYNLVNVKTNNLRQIREQHDE